MTWSGPTGPYDKRKKNLECVVNLGGGERSPIQNRAVWMSWEKLLLQSLLQHPRGKGTGSKGEQGPPRPLGAAHQ